MFRLTGFQRLFTLSILLLAGISSATPPGSNPVYRPHCWHPTVADISPTTFNECLEAINKVIIGRDPEEVLRFSSESSLRPDIKLPTKWTIPGPPGRRCMVALQWSTDAPIGGDDHTTLLDIKGAAMAAAIRCVIRPPHLGGTVLVGWKEHMVVNVLKLGIDQRGDDNNFTLSTE